MNKKNNQYYIPGVPLKFTKRKAFFSDEEIEQLLLNFDKLKSIKCVCGSESVYGIPAPGHAWYCPKDKEDEF